MEAAIEEALRLAGDDPDIRGGVWLSARGLLSLVREDRARALKEMDQGLAILRQGAVLPDPLRSVWALLRTLVGQEGEAARREVAESGITVLPVNRAILGYAEALGRSGDRGAAEAAFEEAEALLASRPGSNGLRQLTRRLLGEAALADGWGQPTVWLAEAATFFGNGGYERVAAACHALLRQHGVAVPRKGRGDAVVPDTLQRAGVTSREVDVLALVGERLSTREIAERLVLSPRTVEKHVERLLGKLGVASRSELVALARQTLDPSTP
jgi:DNA-binding CsgD family transcriptional regulator